MRLDFIILGICFLLWLPVVYYTSRAWHAGKEKQAKITFRDFLNESKKERKETTT